MSKIYDEKCADIEQRIRRLQAEKRKLKRQQQRSEREHRNHVMIVVGAHLLTHYPGAEERLLEMTDEEIRNWVDTKVNGGWDSY